MRLPPQTVALLAALLVGVGCAGSSGGIDASLGLGGPAAGGPGSTASASTSTLVAVGAAATTTTTTPAPTTSPTPAARAPVVLGFAGDTAFTAGADARDPLAAVAGLLGGPDLMVLNLETAVADEGVGVAADKEFTFRSPPASVDLLTAAGVDVVTLANNHVLDFGEAGLGQTLAELDARGLGRVGAGLDPGEAYRPLVVPVGGWTVGLVSLSRVPCDWARDDPDARPQVAWACPEHLALADAAVSEAVATADVAVVLVHGGTEREPCPSPHMAELVTRWAGLGADVVIDGHPHVLQGVETVGDALVVHSTGNFAFPSARGETAESAVFLVEASEAGLSLRVEPVTIAAGVVTPATGSTRTAILDRFEERSFGWVVDDDGTARPDPAAVGACGPASDPAGTTGGQG